jgi:hypothetical protein
MAMATVMVTVMAISPAMAMAIFRAMVTVMFPALEVEDRETETQPAGAREVAAAAWCRQARSSFRTSRAMP